MRWNVSTRERQRPALFVCNLSCDLRTCSADHVCVMTGTENAYLRAWFRAQKKEGMAVGESHTFLVD